MLNTDTSPQVLFREQARTLQACNVCGVELDRDSAVKTDSMLPRHRAPPLHRGKRRRKWSVSSAQLARRTRAAPAGLRASASKFCRQHAATNRCHISTGSVAPAAVLRQTTISAPSLATALPAAIRREAYRVGRHRRSEISRLRVRPCITRVPISSVLSSLELVVSITCPATRAENTTARTFCKRSAGRNSVSKPTSSARFASSRPFPSRSRFAERQAILRARNGCS